MTDLSAERQRLADVAERCWQKKIDRLILGRYARATAAWFRGESRLDITSRNDCQTKRAINHLLSTVAIDGVGKHLPDLRHRFLVLAVAGRPVP